LSGFSGVGYMIAWECLIQARELETALMMKVGE
jgi:hypothetical protein